MNYKTVLGAGNKAKSVTSLLPQPAVLYLGQNFGCPILKNCQVLADLFFIDLMNSPAVITGILLSLKSR